MHHSRLSTFVIDCRTESADEAARFWSAALGRAIEGADGEYRQLAGSADEPILLVQKVDHPSRIHLDIAAHRQQRLARLLADGKLGSALIDVDENGQTQTIDNDAYWEAVLKLIRSNLNLNAERENQQNFLKSQYIRWGTHVGGTKWKPEFEKLRQELIPDYKSEDLEAPATQP